MTFSNTARLSFTLIVLSLPWLAGRSHAQSPTSNPEAAFTIAGPGLDVGLLVSDLDKFIEFYGGVLALKPISFPADAYSAKTAVYQAGASAIRLHELQPLPPRRTEGVMTMNGIRLLAILTRGSESIAKRFVAAGMKAPQFAPAGSGAENYKVALVSDPDGNTIELVAFDGDVPQGALTGFQIGLTVSDAERARRFYGTTIGLPERPPLRLPDTIATNTMQYMFRANATMIKFWAPPTTRVTHPGEIGAALGIRYISIPVADLDAAIRTLTARGAKIVQSPLLQPNAKRTLVTDPDGNVIELAATR